MAKILIVDDSKTSRKFLRAVIEEAGHEVVGEAADGQEGVRQYLELLPDLVTMDITMPVMDGITAVGEICSRVPEAVIVMVTAASQKSNVLEALKRGASDFIGKPFKNEEIIHTINRLLPS